MSWYKKASFGEYKDIMPSNQEGSMGIVFDVQRYGFDNYFVRTALSKTEDNISVSIVVTNGDLGNTTYSNYWYYEKNELDESRKIYNKLNKELKELVDKFVKERIPTTLLGGYIKLSVHDLDKEHSVEYNIPNVNYAKNIVDEPDWRKNIYGNRYPKYQEYSKKQQTEKRKNLFFD